MTPIIRLGLWVRTYNCLKRAGIDTVEELCDRTRDDILKIRNASKKTLENIEIELAKIGLKLKEGDADK